MRWPLTLTAFAITPLLTSLTGLTGPEKSNNIGRSREMVADMRATTPDK
jgi:hypothetical protein